jgi:pyruvate dehydrogenase E2 component (dihydrolipoamide acetyltransferase)
MTDVLMPALSPTMEEGTLAKWLVKVGDTVKSGDVIAEIETDKATMEVEAADEGVVEAILVPEGTEEVKINTPIARLKGEGEEAASSRPSAPPSSAAPPQAEETKPPSPPATPSTQGSAPNGAGARASSPGEPGERVTASPLARRLAVQLGIELSTIKGSGPHGRIIRRDVEASRRPGAPAAVVAARAPEAPAAKEAERGSQALEPIPAGQARSLEQMGIAPGSYDLVPLDGVKKTIARRMTDSFRDVPHFPLSIDIQIDALLAAREKINRMLEKDGVKVSLNDMVIKACAACLKKVPEANASYTPAGIAMHYHADIAVAVAIDGGLITPIVRQAESKGLEKIASEMKDLAERARGRKLRPDEFQGGTFSVSNLGMFGVKSFASIINEPQGAILSVGAGEPRPVVKDGVLAIATMMSVTLTCDHRVVDGAIGARWLAAFKAMLEDPIVMLI